MAHCAPPASQTHWSRRIQVLYVLARRYLSLTIEPRQALRPKLVAQHFHKEMTGGILLPSPFMRPEFSTDAILGLLARPDLCLSQSRVKRQCGRVCGQASELRTEGECHIQAVFRTE